MFKRILIANRGEIAVRIIKTAKDLGIETIAVYSDADKTALHVEQADDAYCLPGIKSLETYLDIDQIIAIAKKARVDAIHPGYGFLSENAEFARRCKKENLIFIGPPAEAIEAMGSKSAAKMLMQTANVPVVPGYQGEDQSLDIFRKEAKCIGYPVLLKAALGGGGKGMRAVYSESEMAESLASVKREAEASFGDGQILIEKFLQKTRHIEVQVFSDNKGNCVHCFERDCSIQRRHQKIVEEAPAVGLSSALRDSMGEAAVRAAKAINYSGAGTIEFLLDEAGQFYFMEMNTRLQVEHPVTECVIGHDLVEWQLRIASGESLPVRQEALSVKGHAIEVRIYAEDPANQFLPQTGRLLRFRLSDWAQAHAIGSDVRIRLDTGVRCGDEVSMHYDPMLAKLIVWSPERNQTIQALQRALSDLQIFGVKTNAGFLQTILANDAYLAGEVATDFIDSQQVDLRVEPETDVQTGVLLATLEYLHQQAVSSDKTEPWQTLDNWVMNAKGRQQVTWYCGGVAFTVEAMMTSTGYTLNLADKSFQVSIQPLERDARLCAVNDERFKASLVLTEEACYLQWHGQNCQLQRPKHNYEQVAEAEGCLSAPMPGILLEVKVQAGDLVEQGQPLLILEAMKMEHVVNAPTGGRVVDLHYQQGDVVQEGNVLLTLEDM